VSAASNVLPFELADTDTGLVRLPEGEYCAVYEGHARVRIFRTMKLRVDFRLLAHPDLVLPRWYRIAAYSNGRVRAYPSSDIVREVSAVLGRRVRHDRIAVASLAGLPLKVIVRTTTTDSKQRPLAEVNRYSLIERLVWREL